MTLEESISEDLVIVSKRLLIVSAAMLALTVALFILPLSRGRFPVSWFCFGVGVIGGFVSIQQRLRLLSEQELKQLAQSWVHILMIPLFGGIFALVFYLLTLSGLLEGAIFPAYSMTQFAEPATTEDLRRFLTETYPASGQDLAKLGFWAFVAGFSERFLPDIIERTVGRART